MANLTVVTFFYGSYMNLSVLRELDVTPEHVEVARLTGFDISIRPLANLVRSDRNTVYGILASATHVELARLYVHAEEKLGGLYLPEAVVVNTLDGKLQPALCYIAPALDPAPASEEYVERIVQAAREHGFPEWYIERLERFRPRS